MDCLIEYSLNLLSYLRPSLWIHQLILWYNYIFHLIRDLRSFNFMWACLFFFKLWLNSFFEFESRDVASPCLPVFFLIKEQFNYWFPLLSIQFAFESLMWVTKANMKLKTIWSLIFFGFFKSDLSHSNFDFDEEGEKNFGFRFSTPSEKFFWSLIW